MQLLKLFFMPHYPSGGTIVDFSKLSPPSALRAENNDKRIEEVKAQMGDKYLLAKPVQRKTK